VSLPSSVNSVLLLSQFNATHALNDKSILESLPHLLVLQLGNLP